MQPPLAAGAGGDAAYVSIHLCTLHSTRPLVRKISAETLFKLIFKFSFHKTAFAFDGYFFFSST